MYIELFLSFLQIGLFSFGGGYSAIPLIQNQVVEKHSWLTMTEFADIVTIAEMTPGPVLINSATFVGIRVAGFLGAIVATIGSIFPSAVIVLTLAYLFKKYSNQHIVQGVLSGLRPAVVALITSAGISLLILALWGDSASSFIDLADTNIVALLSFIIAFFILRKYKINPILVMFGTGIFGMLFYL